MYTLPPDRKGGVRILALDPGPTNMGISVISIVGNKPVVIANAVMACPVKGLAKNFKPTLNTFLAELDLWVKKYKPTGIVAERFQSRGLRGNTGEEVSIMLGAVAVKYSRLPMKLITAVTWKGPLQKRFQIDMKKTYMLCCTTPHQLDSVLIGIYGAELGLKRKLNFTIEQVIAMAEKTSATRLIARVSRKKK